jgi:cytochrome P450
MTETAQRLPPGPRPHFPGQNYLAFQRDPLHYLQNAHQRYGDVVHLHLGGQPVFLLNHPDFVREVLVSQHRKFIKSPVLRRTRILLGDGLLTSEGELHLRQRRLIQPAFHRQAVEGYARLMVDSTLRASQRWQDGQEIDLHAEMMHLTMTIVSQALFGADVEREAPHIGQAITLLLDQFGRLSNPMFEKIERLPTPGNRARQQAGLLLDETIRRMIAERRTSGAARHDLLDMLLSARDEGDDSQGMSDQQIRDEALTLFLAGHETTANALTWSLHLLGEHPWVEDRLHAELREVLGGRAPEAEDVERLVYTRQVLAEAMRLYPPAWVIGREATEPFQAGDYRLPPGAVILLSQWVMHRDDRFYPLPERFDPDRFTPEAQAARPRFAYFPFGGGPRMCVGEPFAWMEGVLLLAVLLQRWQMRHADSFRWGLAPSITLRPRYGMPVMLFRRPDSPE